MLNQMYIVAAMKHLNINFITSISNRFYVKAVVTNVTFLQVFQVHPDHKVHQVILDLLVNKEFQVIQAKTVVRGKEANQAYLELLDFQEPLVDVVCQVNAVQEVLQD
jgi:hypothetical protein